MINNIPYESGIFQSINPSTPESSWRRVVKHNPQRDLNRRWQNDLGTNSSGNQGFGKTWDAGRNVYYQVCNTANIWISNVGKHMLKGANSDWLTTCFSHLVPVDSDDSQQVNTLRTQTWDLPQWCTNRQRKQCNISLPKPGSWEIIDSKSTGVFRMWFGSIRIVAIGKLHPHWVGFLCNVFSTSRHVFL